MSETAFNLKLNQTNYSPMTELKQPEVKNYVNGSFTRNGQTSLNVINPSNGAVISTLPMSTYSDLDEAVIAAKKAFIGWSAMTIKERALIFFRYRALLEKNMDELSKLVQLENGKTYGESKAEIEKSMELCEFACSMPQIISNEVQEVSKGVECRIEKKPLGVVASIAPFNFPNMVPHWTMPNALVLGNTMIMKPSELVPLSVMKMAELLDEAGLPKGVFNIINGGKETVEAICDHPGIEAVSFVGSTTVAKIVYKRATSNLKRCVALGGAKNHLIVLPDAHVQMTASNVVASMSGCAGQRCMAAAVMVGVGDIQYIIDQMVVEAKKIIPGNNLGSVITKEAQTRIEGYIAAAEAAGAKILVDGRGVKVAGNENGYYVGPTIIDHVTTDMSVAKEEIFGPVISIVRAKDLAEAIAIENSSDYGNAAAVFTQSGGLARQVMDGASAGMIGVNIGVPVPREPFPFGGWNDSKFGVGDITGRSSIEFWAQNKKTTVKWNPEAQTNWMS
ncbi:MAG: malonate-semialdehyde dehydrogenase (acetylating)/methylmalonate-semialdehyde dehydrogenase [Glaciecola sp.]|jgi:malonate-semialdehyde dehydrogenase (acetylating)/methylmalonate-semialdehyde dehydrogenase